MLNGFDSSLEDRLKKAEQAELEVSRLQALASEAPGLRNEKAKAQRTAERRRTKEAAIALAREAADAASEKQAHVPELLGNAGRAINQLYVILKDIEARRQDAMQSLAVADRVDYDMELEDGEEQERSMDRDPRGLAYALAGRHGDARVKKLLEDLKPGFGPLSGCNLDEPLYRDVANFVMQRVTPAAPPLAAAANSKANTKPISNGVPAVPQVQEVSEAVMPLVEQE